MQQNKKTQGIESLIKHQLPPQLMEQEMAGKCCDDDEDTNSNNITIMADTIGAGLVCK